MVPEWIYSLCGGAAWECGCNSRHFTKSHKYLWRGFRWKVYLGQWLDVVLWLYSCSNFVCDATSLRRARLWSTTSQNRYRLYECQFGCVCVFVLGLVCHQERLLCVCVCVSEYINILLLLRENAWACDSMSMEMNLARSQRMKGRISGSKVFALGILIWWRGVGKLNVVCWPSGGVVKCLFNARIMSSWKYIWSSLKWFGAQIYICVFKMFFDILLQ